MKILFLSDNFPPEVNAPASRTFEHCRRWAQRGHPVTIITGFPNFPGGRLFEGHRNRLWQWEKMDGMRVLRVWTYIAANEGFIKRTLDYMSFMVAAVCASALTGSADVVVGTSPQFFTACAAWAVSRVKRAPFVLELRDLWPDSIVAVGAMRDGWILDLLRRLESFLYGAASKIVSVTHSFVEVLSRRGVDRKKMAVVVNGVDLARFSPRPRDEDLARRLGLAGKFVAGYIGTLGMAHGLEALLESARLMRSDDGFRLLFLGDGARKESLRRLAAEQGLSNVVFVDSVAKEEVVRYWSLLDVSIIHLRRDPLFETVIPSKLFECMGMGLPVILGVKGETAEIVERHGIGLIVEPENARQIASAIARLKSDPSLLRDLGKRALRTAPLYERNRQADEMLRILESASRRELPSKAAVA